MEVNYSLGKTEDNFSVNKYIFWTEGIDYRQEQEFCFVVAT
jgi:hypothetical protein